MIVVGVGGPDEWHRSAVATGKSAVDEAKCPVQADLGNSVY